MIRLVVSDIDGTLLPEGSRDLNPELFEVVRRLQARGITFVAATGREEASFRVVMEPIFPEIYAITGNGNLIWDHGQCVATRTMPADVVKEILEYIRNRYELTCRLLNTTGGTYTETPKHPSFAWMNQGYGLDVGIVEDLCTIPEAALKLSILVPEDKDAQVEAVEPKQLFGDRVSCVAAGARWVDFVHLEADKGKCLANLQKRLGVTREETMVFGDNANDLSMLAQAEESYAAPGAREVVKRAAKHVLDGDLWDSVINEMKKLL